MIMRFPEVLTQTGLSKATVYRLVKEGDFPSQVQLAARSVGWHSDDIENWIRERLCKQKKSCL
jgi:prophage regulatory protein